MTIGYLREVIKNLPDSSPVVMWIQHDDRPEVMAQASHACRINCGLESASYLVSPSYLMLTAYERDIIRDGKLKPVEPSAQLPLPFTVDDDEFVDVDELVDLPAEIGKTHWGPIESTDLAVIDSKGKPGGIMKRWIGRLVKGERS
jgi:hypothetical protein